MGQVAVEDLSFVVQPGRVTGFLGPNDAGRSTTMWLILGSAAAVYLVIEDEDPQ